MTAKEEQVIKELLQAVKDLKTENQKFCENTINQINAINQKIEKKHLPIYYEQDILKVAQQSINEAISKCMTGYDSSLNKLVKSVVDENSAELRAIISDSFTQVIKTPDFKQSIINAF